MGEFDQRHQQVKGNQTNVAGNQYVAGRDFNQVTGDQGLTAKVLGELNGLLAQVQEAAGSGELDQDIALDVEYSVKKAAREAEKGEPGSMAMLEHLDTAKKFLNKAAGVTKAGTGLATAAGAAYTKIQGWL